MTALLYSLLLACSGNSMEGTSTTTTKEQKQSIVVYSGRGESMVDKLFEKMEDKGED